MEASEQDGKRKGIPEMETRAGATRDRGKGVARGPRGGGEDSPPAMIDSGTFPGAVGRGTGGEKITSEGEAKEETSS
jgi:hypothetical protein